MTEQRTAGVVRGARVPGRGGYVGRERELSLLMAALAEPGALVLVEGEAGIGKTRLIRECLDGTELSGLRVLEAGCPPLPEPFPLGPIVDALHRHWTQVGQIELSPLGGALRPLFPEWAADLPPALEPLEDPGATRHRLFRALIELITRTGADLLVVEDAHWADAATMELLLMLAAAAGRSIRLVVTYRPTDVADGAALRGLARPPGTSRSAGPEVPVMPVRLVLEPLSLDETTRLIATFVGTDRVSAEFAAFLHERTDGVPLAVEESVSLLQERGDIVRRGAEWTRRSLHELQVPPTVRDSILERVERLDPAARRVLEAAATLAEPVSEDLLGRVSGQPAEATRAGLAAALNSGLLREAEAASFVCRHALASKALEEAMPVSERRRLHRRAAEALRDIDPSPVARLSRHFREAGDTAEWSHFAEAAADRALASGDDHTALVTLLELLTATDHPGSERVRLARKLAEAAAWGAGGLGELGGQITDALYDVLGGDGIPETERGEIRLLLGRLLLQLGEFEAASAEIDIAVSDLDERPVMAARAMISLAIPRGHDWPAGRHLEWLRRASALLPKVAPGPDRTSLIVDRASALLLLGENEGWAAADEITAHGDSLFERRQVARGLMNVSHSAIVWGRHDDARDRLDVAIELMRATGYQRLLNSARLTKAQLDWHEGVWNGLAEQVEELAGTPDTQPEAQLDAALVLGLLGQASGARDSAEPRLRRVLAEAARRGLVDMQAAPAAALGRLYLADGDAAAALAVTTPVIELIARKDMWLCATEVAPTHLDALVAAGRLDLADTVVGQLAAGLTGRDVPAGEAAATVCRAITAGAAGDARGAAHLLADAAQAWADLPRPYLELLTIERRATELLAAGDPEPSLELLTAAESRLRALGARWDADRVAHRLRQRGVEVARTWRGGRRGYGDQLSPRELEVVRLVARGLTNRQTAETLFLSPRTVDRHLSAAMRKLGVTSRTALAVAAHDGGLLEP